ncbi:unnamed protein product, partial [Prorocentrum cordatum]
GQLLKAPREHLVKVLTDAFQKSKRDAAAKASDHPDKLAGALEYVIDEVGHESKQAYKVKMSIWCSSSLEALNSEVFWLVMEVRHRCGEPLRHFRAVLQKHNEYVRTTGAGAMAHLVWGQAHAIQSKLDALLDLEAWKDVISDSVPLGLLATLHQMVIHMALPTAADFRRRVTDRVNDWSWKLFWLAREGPSVRCRHREEVARELLDAGDGDLDAQGGGARKVREIFNDNICQCAETGLCDVHFWGFLRMLTRMFQCDSEELESVNSQIKLVVKKAPRIQLPLLSCRVNLSKACGLGTSAARHSKWSLIASDVAAVKQ